MSSIKLVRYTIYCHTHIDSGRRYVGLTSQTVEKRWKNHVHAAKSSNGKNCFHFANAIRKYGKDAFTHEVLEVCTDLDQANLAEEWWVRKLDSRNPLKGFNLKQGGSHTPHPIKNPWDRPEYRAKSAIASKKRWERSEFRAAVIKGVEKAWADPAHHARMSAISKEVNSRPQVKEAISAAASFRPGKSSRFRGVCWNKKLCKWLVSFRQNGKMVNIGHFSDEEEAARVYDREVVVCFGDKARLNFLP